MGIIRKLSPEVINSIAAGEVVERPASALKELIENSIDAQSTEISVHITGSGEEGIKIVDNGMGIEKDDIPLALERHATSKITNIMDLAMVTTLGFRGEALPSIAAISRFSIKSRTDKEDVGYLLKIDYGKMFDIKPIAMNKGTVIEIKDMFSNLPVRKGFLKSPSTEYYHCEETFIRYALAFPKIRFRFYNDGREKFSLYPASLEERIVSLFPYMKGKLILIKGKGNGFSFTGYISSLNALYKRAKKQYAFINGRPIYSRSIVNAVYRGYHHALQGKHPFFVLFLQTDPLMVDVNVHPRKWEVRFSESANIEEAIVNSIKNIWKESISISDEDKKEIFRNNFYREENPRVSYVKDTYSGIDNKMQLSLPLQEPKEIKKERLLRRYLQVLDTYIIFSTSEGMVVIDQHAAGERIMYEKLLKNRREGKTQSLLFPVQVQLSIYEEEIYKSVKKFLYDIGFRISKFAGNIYVIEGVPPGVKDVSAEAFLDILQEKLPAEDMQDEVLKRIACNMAVKAGHKMEEEEMQNLVLDLLSCDNPFFCPHGRPTIIEYKKEEIEKWFHRT